MQHIKSTQQLKSNSVPLHKEGLGINTEMWRMSGRPPNAQAKVVTAILQWRIAWEYFVIVPDNY